MERESMSRKNERKTGAAVIAGLLAFCFAGGVILWGQSKQPGEAINDSVLDELNITYEEITVPGLEQEYEIFFMADSHVSLCDERDATVMEKAQQRQTAFVDENGVASPETFSKMVQASNELGADLFIMGGDVLDSAMYASVEHVQEQLENLEAPYLYSFGNHDFEYGTEYFSQAAYSTYLPRLENLRDGADEQAEEYEYLEGENYQVVEYEDLVVLAVDDENNQIGDEAAEALEDISDEGKATIVVSHVPFEPLTGDTALWQETVNRQTGDKSISRVLIGEKSCYPNADTLRFREQLLEEDSPVEVVLSGHIHFYHKDSLNGEVTQIVTGAAYQKAAVHLTLKPG